MVRTRILALALVSLCSGAHANVVKDTGRVFAGTAIGAAGMATAQAAYNAAKMLIWDGAWDSKNFPGLDYQMMRVCAAVGGVTGLMQTTYGRTLRAQWKTWWWTSRDLIAITMNEYGDETQLVDALEHYYLAHSYPLISAKRELASKLAYLHEAAQLIEKALADIAEDSLRAEELNDWLDEIYTTRAYVAHAAQAVERDPRLLALMDAQNRLDQTNAMWADAIAHAAVAASNSRK